MIPDAELLEAQKIVEADRVAVAAFLESCSMGDSMNLDLTEGRLLETARRLLGPLIAEVMEARRLMRSALYLMGNDADRAAIYPGPRAPWQPRLACSVVEELRAALLPQTPKDKEEK